MKELIRVKFICLLRQNPSQSSICITTPLGPPLFCLFRFVSSLHVLLSLFLPKKDTYKKFSILIFGGSQKSYHYLAHFNAINI